MDQPIGFTTASQITSGPPYKYEDVIPIKAYNSSCWMVKFPQGQILLEVWHKEAKIEDIVEAMKMQFPGTKFTVAALDVGAFWIQTVENSMSNGRMVNQDMEVVI